MEEIELINKRKPREKHFLQKNGTIVAKIYDRDVHFLKNGVYEEIDNNLIKRNGCYINKNNDYSVSYNEKSDNVIMKLSKGKHFLNILMSNINTVKANRKSNLSKTESIIKYENIMDGVDLNYQNLPTKVKETITLQNNDYDKLSFYVETDLKLVNQDNSIIAIDIENNSVFTIEKPYMEDAVGKTNENIYYNIIEKKNKYELELILDSDWLKSEERVYPVIIDPTIVNNGQNTNLYDTYIYPGDTLDNRNSYPYLKAGVERISGQDRINRALIKFELPEIGTGSEIVGAYLELTGYPTNTAYPRDNIVTMHRVTQDWNETTANWATMNDKFDSKVESIYYGSRSTLNGNTVIPAYNYYSGDITNLVKKWYRDTPNYGLMLKSAKEVYIDDDFAAFYSKDNTISGNNNPKPIFQLVYRNHNGIESYLNYKELFFVDGSTYVNTYNGNLVGVFHLGHIVGSKLPCELDLIYNTNDVVLQNNTIYGKGYKLNLNQSIKEVTISNLSYLEYNDENGTIHYFYKDENTTEDIYKDEDNLSLTIEKNSSTCIMRDKDNNVMTFSNYNNVYYLTNITDINQNSITIEFVNSDYNKISRIYDSNNNEINLSYSNNEIEVTSSDATVLLNYSNSNLISIVTPNGTTQFTYDNNNLISDIIDISGTKISYEYYDNSPYRLKKIEQYGLNNELGQSFTMNYGFDTTSIVDNMNRTTNLIFNSSGNLISSNSLKNGEDLSGAYSITSEFGIEGQSKNKIVNVNSPVRYIKNYLKNTSFELDTNYFEIDDERIIKSFDITNYVSGNRSLKLETLMVGQSIEQSVVVPKGNYYTFSGYFKTNEDITISLSYADSNNVLVSSEEVVNSSTEFVREDVTIYYDENANSDLKIRISIPNISTLYVDDIQLEEGEVANNYNIIENSDFSDGYSDWTSSSWVYDDSDTPPTNFLEVVNFNNNQNKALKIKMNPLYGTRISKTLPIKGKQGDLYTISFWYKNEGYYADGGSVGNSVSIYFKPVGQDAEYCIMTSDPFNPNDETWQYFTYRDKAIEDFESITITFLQGREANNLYITNMSFYKELTSGDYNYDSKGNVISIENQSKEKSLFNYDENNQLLNATSPIGKNFKYEYDNEKKSKLLSAISSSGIANEIKYDSFGNPISTRIVKRSTSELDGNNFRIRSKGTDKYIKARSREIVVETDPCSNTIWTFIQTNDNYKILHSLFQNYSISIANDLVKLSPQDENNLFELEENENGSYHFKSLVTGGEGNLVRYLKVNGTTLELATLEENDPSFEFYIESVDAKFIENSATYSSDGRFVTSVTDSSFNTTTYSTDNNTGLVNYKINPKGIRTDYVYNNKKQLTSISIGNKTVNYTYNNNLLSKIDTGNEEYNLIYDNFLNISKIKIGNSITFLENTFGERNGNLLSVKYGNNQMISYQYDEFDRIKKLTKSNAVYDYKYDNNGKVAKILSNNNEIKAFYDKAGRLYNYKNNNFKINYTYNAENDVTNIVYKNNNIENEVINNYDKDGFFIKSLFENQFIDYNYDSLNRISSKNINGNFNTQYEYISFGNRTTLLPKSINNNNDIFEYKYDKMDNITHIYHNGNIQKVYTYNDYNELLEEENHDTNTKITYTYDLYGNILSKQIRDISTNSLIATDNYQYSLGDWKDQMIGYNNDSITYDGVGNPITIGNNIQLQWINGRELSNYSDSSNNLIISYTYDDKGIRTSKTINGVQTNYYLEGNKVIYEETNGNVIYYIRDNDGLVGLKYNNNVYYYIKNAQGDIIGILDNNMNQIVSYQYDSWGKIINITDNSIDNIGAVNPYRYRSYYYDKETDLYYLNSRYYNPTWCRFLNADNYIGSTGDHNGYNLYSYVSNNPINNADPSGQSLKSLLKKVSKTVKKVVKTAKKVVKKVVNTVKSAVKTVINTVTSVVKAVVSSKKTFVAEGQVGLGLGGKVGTGPTKVQAEASKGFGWGYRSDTGNYEFTSNSIGATTDVFEKEDLEFGLGAELRNYDKYTNPMIMPWEVWDSENTTKETTIGLSKGATAGAGARDYTSKSDTVFIGLDLGGYLYAGGEIKIGWELEF